jgi:hypothetical protein
MWGPTLIILRINLWYETLIKVLGITGGLESEFVGNVVDSDWGAVRGNVSVEAWNFLGGLSGPNSWFQKSLLSSRGPVTMPNWKCTVLLSVLYTLRAIGPEGRAKILTSSRKNKNRSPDRHFHFPVGGSEHLEDFPTEERSGIGQRPIQRKQWGRTEIRKEYLG